MRAGRWHDAGRPLTYLSGTPAGALLEFLASLEIRPERIPQSFPLLRITCPESISRLELDPSQLSPDWIKNTRETRAYGNKWLSKAETAMLVVPSALCPETWNWLLNPRHPEAALVQVKERTNPMLDIRLL